MVGRIVPAMGFSADDTADGAALVEYHLLLPETATRRDLADPRTAANVADGSQTVERLELLRALTEADSLATGPSAWSKWKESLIDRLSTPSPRCYAAATSPPATSRGGALGRRYSAGAPTGGVVGRARRSGEFHGLRVASSDRPGLFVR